MTPLKQLFRQPVRLFAIFLLVGMASAFICLSAGVFASAKATLAQIEERYVTIGVPTTKTADVATEYNGLTLHHEESVISQDMWAYMDQLAADGTVIKGAYQQKYISAYCPSIQSVTSGKEDGTYAPSLDSPYNRAIMIVRVTSVDKTNLPESTELASVSVTASIENVVKMHPDYAVRSTLRLIIGCNSQEELDALDIRPGGRYLVFGSDYIDRDLELRTTLAGTHRCSVEDIDLSRISYDLTEDEKKTASPDFLPIAKYSSGEKTTILGQDMVDAIDSCTMTVTHWHGLYSETQLDYAIDGSETGVLLNDQYLDAYMTQLETDLDVFLSSNAGVEWRSAVQELDTQYHTVSVIGTDLLESMYCFHQKDSFVTEGRSFGADDYKKGSNVCLISETTALASGLGIGDSIDLSFYWGPNPLADLTAPEWKVQPQRFSQKIGVSGDAKTYQIIGIYRQSDLWDTADYRFLPNTVFVPNTCLLYTSKERKALITEKKELPIYHVKRHKALAVRITELTEELEELRSEKALLLQKFEYAEDAGAEAFHKDIAAMEAGLKKLETQEQKYSAELDKALDEYAELKAQAADFDPVELYEARQAIRPAQEKAAEQQLEDALQKKPSFSLLLNAKQETSRLLKEDTEERQVRQMLIRRQRSDPQKPKHFQR